MTIYASLEEYRTLAQDERTSDEVIEQELAILSVRLRAEVGISSEYGLNDDAALLARALVIDAARKKFNTQSFNDVDVPVGISGVSFGANGFSESWQISNASGSAYWDRTMLEEFKNLIEMPTQSISWSVPYAR